MAMSVGDRNSVSGRLQNWDDWDGSTSGRNGRTLIGSNINAPWWKLDSNCVRKASWRVWLCDASEPHRAAGSIKLIHDNTGWNGAVGSNNWRWGSVHRLWSTHAQCDNSWGNPAPCSTVGRISLVGMGQGQEAHSLPLTPNPEITGPVGGLGWYAEIDAGAPVRAVVASIQIPSSSTLMLVLRYPAGTSFTISLRPNWWHTAGHEQFTQVGSVDAVRDGSGNT